jgi:hypothetical protein
MIEIRPHPASMASLNSQISRLAESTGQTLKEVLPSQMRLLAADLAAVTLPKGKGGSDNRQGISRTESRIAEVYPPPGSVVKRMQSVNPGAAGKFAAMLSDRQWAKAQKLLNQFLPELNMTIGAFDSGALHKSQRYTKRITKRLLVPGYSRVQAYAKKKSRLVGFAKGGFAAAARQLGGVRGIPGWVGRQKSPGAGTITGDGKTLAVTMTSGVAYLREAMKPHDEAAALSFREKQVSAVLKRIQDRRVREIMRSNRR